jgi:chloramphenicol 3-O phosphotransferase
MLSLKTKKQVLILAGIAMVVCSAGYRAYKSCCNKDKLSIQNTSTIIILNGPSAAGKSSMQREIQNIFPDPYLKIGIDNFVVALIPDRYLTGDTDKSNPEKMIMRGTKSTDAAGNPVFTLEIGKRGQKIFSGMHHAIAAYAAQGNNIVVDYIMYERKWMTELAQVLKDFRVYFVGVKIPLAVLEEREKLRGTSPIGHARSHHETVHAGLEYDIEVDTSLLTAKECAEKIKNFVGKNPEPKAFKMLLQRD